MQQVALPERNALPADRHGECVARVLLTGMSGTGKTTVPHELQRRGNLTVDTEYDGWVGTDGLWNEARMARLLASTPSCATLPPADGLAQRPWK
jgi:ATP-dependent phosphoenolpyruvate carboxykinase